MNYLVSFPRSGQELTRSLLADVYQRFGWDFSYCAYDCCKTAPCSKGKLFRKDHDFGLKLNVGTSPYIVLYRMDMIEQMEAYFRWSQRKKYQQFDYDDPETLESVVHFIKTKRVFYERFVCKWVHTNPALAFEYNDYIRNPVSTLLRITSIFRPADRIEESVIRDVIDNRNERIEFRYRLPKRYRAMISASLQE